MGKKKQAKKATKQTKAAAGGSASVTIDTTLALPRALTPTQSRHLVKIGDADRAFIKNEFLPQFTTDATKLGVKGLTPDDVSQLLAHRDAQAAAHDAVERLLARFAGAVSLTDDSLWHDVLKVRDYVELKAKEDASIASDWQFLEDYFKKRHGHPLSSGDDPKAPPPPAK